MKTTAYILSLLISLNLLAPARSQDFIHKDSIDVVNIGEGRILHRLRSTGELLEGSQRIIDGTTSGYYTANFTEGLFDGPYALYRTEGKLVEEGEYSGGRKHGVTKEYYSDGAKVRSAITYAGGKRSGLTTTYYLDGSREFETEYIDGLRDGYEKRWSYPDGHLIMHDHYTRDTLNGSSVKVIRHNVSDFTVSCYYRMGILHGKYNETYLDGVVRKDGAYVDGKRFGKWQGQERYLGEDGKMRSKKFKANY